jgi:hypothetical protein
MIFTASVRGPRAALHHHHAPGLARAGRGTLEGMETITLDALAARLRAGERFVLADEDGTPLGRLEQGEGDADAWTDALLTLSDQVRALNAPTTSAETLSIIRQGRERHERGA